MTTVTHDTNTITQLLPVVIAILFFVAGWLAGRMRWWGQDGQFDGQNRGSIRSDTTVEQAKHRICDGQQKGH